MCKDVLRLFIGAMLLAWPVVQASADALIRAWAESGNEFPVRLSVQGVRGGFPTHTVRTVRFTLRNPLPRQTFQLQAFATYTTKGGQQVTAYSNPVTLEIDQTARNCRIYFYVINGFVVEGSLLIPGLDLRLSGRPPLVVIPIGEVPAGVALSGQVSIFAQ